MCIFEFLVVDDKRANTEEWKLIIKNHKIYTVHGNVLIIMY